MPASFSLLNRKFGKLLVEAPAFRKKGERGWQCRCKCGVVVPYVLTGSLTSGRTRSCGCGVKEAATTHGQTGTLEYKTWLGMICRCHSPMAGNFHQYGAKGIVVCKRWRKSFESFLVDMGKKPGPRYTIDRIDGKKGYSPKNCRWATLKQQANNQKTNRRIEFNGKVKTLSEWADILGLSSQYTALQKRLAGGWTVEDTFTIPIDKIRKGPGLHFRKNKKS